MIPWSVSLAFLTIIAAIILILVASDQKCHMKVKNATRHLASKTPYEFVAYKEASSMNYPGCTPTHLWGMFRHGTRNPGEKVINKMNNILTEIRDELVLNHNEKRGTLCNSELQLLAHWNKSVEEDGSKKLTAEGENEMFELAKRFQQRFPTLLSQQYSNSTYKFQHTDTHRAKESARRFAKGLFGQEVSQNVYFPEPVYKDPILRFYKLCERWRKSVDKNPESLKEQRQFESGKELAAVVERVSERLGFVELLKVSDVLLMHLTCAFETAWHPSSISPWCSVFSDEDFKVLEYYSDLDYYWIDGYGFEVNHKQACVALKDMFSHFRFDELSKGPTSVLYFSHGGTLLKMLAHIGLYQDEEPLRAENFQKMVENRQWRVGRINSFGTNIVFVQYKCGSEYKILTLHQEKPVIVPGCPRSDYLCPIKTMIDKFKPEECNFDEICAL